ncbi:unnamed protein product [Trichogramma brassicae]|uniref:Uncharacterized protein n=1 Tax=Trichogramma brassicae TaxID=86971 RepID=A0A6H5IU48_9HYME|nr:unnamed protein product [Trichogramma brassicae]
MGSETFVNDVGSMAEIPQPDEKRFVKEDKSRDRSSDHCTFSVVIGCEIPKEIQTSLRRDEKDFIKSLLPNPETLEGGRGTNHFVSQPLTQRDNLFGEQDIEFQVPEEQAEVSMVVLGKISMIDIKMPIEIINVFFFCPPPSLLLKRSRDNNDEQQRSSRSDYNYCCCCERRVLDSCCYVAATDSGHGAHARGRARPALERHQPSARRLAFEAERRRRPGLPAERAELRRARVRPSGVVEYEK